MRRQLPELQTLIAETKTKTYGREVGPWSGGIDAQHLEFSRIPKMTAKISVFPAKSL